jgi:Flp pilus assembly protein TadD
MGNDPDRNRNPGGDDTRDHAHWDAVEDVVELLHAEEFHEALVRLRAIASDDPKNPYAFYFMGVGLYEVGELEPARDAYRAALRLAPKHLGARVALCHVLRQLGDFREAIREGMQALTLAPGDADALHAVGLAYLARGDDAAARKYLEAFLDTHPEFEVGVEVKATLDKMAQDRAAGERGGGGEA